MKDKKYIYLVDGIWHVRVEIPKSLRPSLNNKPRFTQSLRTGDLAEAQVLRWEVVHHFKNRIKEAKLGQKVKAMTLPPMDTEADDLVRDALKYRELFRDASPTRRMFKPGDNLYNPTERQFVVDQIADQAHIIDEIEDEEAAQRFFNAATDKDVPLKEAVEKWQGERKAELAPGTFRIYSDSVHQFMAWADEGLMLSEVTKRLAGSYITDYLKPFVMPNGEHYSQATLKHKVSSIHNIWEWFIMRGYCENNPWHKQAPKGGNRKKEQKRPRFAWPMEDVRKILQSFPTDKRSIYRQTYPDLVRIELMTGARLNELVYLSLRDFKEDGSGLSMHLPGTKNDAAERWIPVHPSIEPIIRRRMSKTNDELFPECQTEATDGSKKRGDAFGQAFGRFNRDKLKLDTRGKDFHALRHTFTTQADLCGIRETTVARMDGHTLRGITFGTYSSADMTRLRDEMFDAFTYGEEIDALIRECPIVTVVQPE